MPDAAVLRGRAAILRAIRDWMHDRGFLEVQVPVAVRSGALEATLEPLALGDLQLHTSPEFALKRALASGLGRIYWMGPCFRGEEHGPHHSMEFTMLEWYRIGCGYRGIAEDTVSLVQACAAAVGVSLPPVERLSFAEALARHAREPVPEDPMERLRIWVNDVETRLESPTLVMDYPASDAAFSALRGDVAERFELYWQGVELANAFTELLDPTELSARQLESGNAREAEGRSPHPIDPRLNEAVGRHPRAGGIALGVDRLVMLLLGLTSIHDARIQP
ncbi:MAG: amino acid--tRNA ligase-related protein [Myxococcota bacterium]|nr:amino acid--tRNA ligase-related protein [Myxococcota bacterium]